VSRPGISSSMRQRASCVRSSERGSAADCRPLRSPVPDYFTVIVIRSETTGLSCGMWR
jgi:hypothetical protein